MQFPRIETSWWDRFFWARARVRRSALYDRRVRRVYRIVAIPRSDAQIKKKEKLYFQEKILHRRLLYFKRGRYEAEMEKHFVCFQEDAFSNTNESSSFSMVCNNDCVLERYIDSYRRSSYCEITRIFRKLIDTRFASFYVYRWNSSP